MAAAVLGSRLDASWDPPSDRRIAPIVWAAQQAVKRCQRRPAFLQRGGQALPSGPSAGDVFYLSASAAHAHVYEVIVAGNKVWPGGSRGKRTPSRPSAAGSPFPVSFY